MLGGRQEGDQCDARRPFTPKKLTHKANSSLRRLRYCFFGFMVWKKGSFITSGQTAGQGLPQIRLGGRNEWVYAANEVYSVTCVGGAYGGPT